MRSRRILWAALAALIIGSLALSACAPRTSSAEPKTATITSREGDPASLNPLYTSLWIEEVIFDLILLPLWNIDNQGNYQLELAAELPTLQNGGVSADGLAVTIRLRPDAVWSDGQPVTADDAVFTYEMIMDPGNTVSSQYPYDTYVAGMTALDEHTLQIQMTEPYIDWSTAIFVGTSRILPRHILEPVFAAEGSLDNADWNRLPTVTNGPFLLTEYVPGSHITFEANDQYWRGRPKLDRIFIRMVEDRAAQLAALQSGQSDIGTYIIGSEIPQIEAMGNIGIQTSENGYQVGLYLNVDPNTAHPAMTDPDVRRALALAIDRQLIIDTLFNGVYVIPATYWHGTVYDNPDIEPYAFDPEEARDLLTQAGWVDTNNDRVREKGGVDLVLRYVYLSGDETSDTMVVTIQQMLGDVGIRVDLLPNTKEVLWASYGDNGPMAHGEYDLTHFSDGMWYFPTPDTSYFLCSQIPSPDYPDGWNWYGVCDPQLEDLFAQQAVELDQQKRVDDFHQIGPIMYDQTYYIPLRNDPDIWAVSERLTNVRFSGVDPLMFAYEWDIK